VYDLRRLILVVVGGWKIFYDLPFRHMGEIWSSHMDVFQGSILPTFRKIVLCLSSIVIIPSVIN